MAAKRRCCDTATKTIEPLTIELDKNQPAYVSALRLLLTFHDDLPNKFHPDFSPGLHKFRKSPLGDVDAKGQVCLEPA